VKILVIIIDTMTSKILKLEDVIEKENDNNIQDSVEKIKKSTKIILPRGNPKSGRPWKSEKQRYFTSLLII